MMAAGQVCKLRVGRPYYRLLACTIKTFHNYVAFKFFKSLTPPTGERKVERKQTALLIPDRCRYVRWLLPGQTGIEALVASTVRVADSAMMQELGDDRWSR